MWLRIRHYKYDVGACRVHLHYTRHQNKSLIPVVWTQCEVWWMYASCSDQVTTSQVKMLQCWLVSLKAVRDVACVRGRSIFTLLHYVETFQQSNVSSLSLKYPRYFAHAHEMSWTYITGWLIDVCYHHGKVVELADAGILIRGIWNSVVRLDEAQLMFYDVSLSNI
jgi:hypothetical protein